MWGFGESKPVAADAKKGYGSTGSSGVDVEAATSFMSSISGLLGNSEDMKKAVDVTRAQFTNLKKYVEEGDWTWKLLGLFGGLGMIGTGVFYLLGDIFTLNIFELVLEIYIIIFGIVAVTLEYKDTILPARWVESLKTEARFIYRPYGRAVLYIFFGILLISQDELFFVINGLYLFAVGVLVAYFSVQAEKALSTLKGAKYSESQIRKAFAAADTAKKGTLTVKQFAVLVKALGSTMSANELESAIGLIDKDASGCISLEEFLKWYNAK